MTDAECREWMIRHLPPGTPFCEVTRLPKLDASGYLVASTSMPNDSGAKTALAWSVYNCYFASEAAVLVYVLNAHIWPSSGHIPLLLSLRKSLGENRSIEEAPGNLFEIEEAADAVSVIVLALQFFWDCLVIGGMGETVFYVSHDEYCNFLSPHQAMIDQFNAEFNKEP